jgi:hypothetical protein
MHTTNRRRSHELAARPTLTVERVGKTLAGDAGWDDAQRESR